MDAIGSLRVSAGLTDFVVSDDVVADKAGPRKGPSVSINTSRRQTYILIKFYTALLV